MAEQPGFEPNPVLRWTAGAVLAVSNFMVVLDTAIANVSVPHIAGTLAISPDQGTWVITSYSVAEAICVPLTGWLAQRFGAVRVFLIGLVGFALFSILCGLSVNLGMLVACRVGQGFCGGPMLPLSQTLLLRIFPPHQRGTALSLWAMTTVVAPIAGPLLGGTISDDWSWHWIFFINVPVAAVCLFSAWTLLRRFETATERSRVDVVGLILLVIWVGALQIMLDIGRDHDWFGSTEIVVLAITAAVGFAFFVVWELTEKQPVVDLRVFRHRGYSAAVFVLAVIYGTMFASNVVTPQWLQGTMGYTASSAGLVTAWQGVFAVVMALAVGPLTSRFDARALVSAGVLWLAFCALLRSHWSSDVGYWSLAIPHLLTGFGTPLFFVPITILALSSVEPRETASAAGLSSFMRTLSGAVGTSVASTVWLDRVQIDRADLVNVAHLPPGLTGRLTDSGFSAAQARNFLSSLVDQQATVVAITQLFQIAAVAFVIGAATVWIVPKPRRAASTEGAH